MTLYLRPYFDGTYSIAEKLDYKNDLFPDGYRILKNGIDPNIPLPLLIDRILRYFDCQQLVIECRY